MLSIPVFLFFNTCVLMEKQRKYALVWARNCDTKAKKSAERSKIERIEKHFNGDFQPKRIEYDNSTNDHAEFNIVFQRFMRYLCEFLRWNYVGKNSANISENSTKWNAIHSNKLSKCYFVSKNDFVWHWIMEMAHK